MTYKEIAQKIKKGYRVLEKDTRDKYSTVCPEIIVENDAGFKAIIIGDITPHSKGYMYLFYSSDDKAFPSIEEIADRLKTVANKGCLTGEDIHYYDWPEFGSLEKQRDYFSEIILSALSSTRKI